ncbi:MAG TPA: Nif3-like dinuclear metal center hexameric protein [Rhodothermales bacterium]|nr:Nif3-like dinuclear metal center hexameric protein [Rhodothermales bacterium]
MKQPPSRRDFLRSAGSSFAALSLSSALPLTGTAPLLHTDPPSATLTIQQAIDRIFAAVPGAPFPNTVDTVKAGDPSQQLKGVVTTFLDTREVLEKAIGLGANFVITHEPTFYNHLDETDWLEGDPVYEAKRKLIDDHGLVVWRFHDTIHAMKPDAISQGLLKDLDWESYVDPDDARVLNLPRTSVLDLAAEIKAKMDLPIVKVVGLPALEVQRVALLPGAWGGRNQIPVIGRPDVDALIVGEVSQWETNEYVRDAVRSGLKKALLILGHQRSEEPGMRWIVPWLQNLLPGVKITHIPAGDPFITL